MQSLVDPAVALVLTILDADKRGSPADDIFAIARRALDERAAQERERIEDIARSIRADYPDDVFPSNVSPAAGARLAIDRLLAAIRALT